MRNHFSLMIAAVLATALISPGCGKSDSGNSGGSSGSGGAQVSGVQKEAQDAVLAEIARHWVKAPDGWITARTSGAPMAPDHYVRQIREISVEGVESFDLGESDKLNGFEWAGQVTFKQAPCREAGDAGMVLEGVGNLTVDRPRGRWSQWVDVTPEPVRVQKQKGQWQITTQDTWLLRGVLPTPDDFAKAGVK